MSNLAQENGTKVFPPGFICGVELEIEDIRRNDFSNGYDGIIMETDNSLRNGGLEFKIPPSTKKQALDRFDTIHKHLKLGPTAFSHRTSTHVHVNMGNLTAHQAKELILVYALLEPLFFEFVGEERKNSIYCVPLSFTYLPSLYKNSLGPLWEKWHKYTAFNIKPVRDMGTFEFRHLFGTGDKKVLNKWLDILEELYLFIEKNPKFILLRHILDINKTISLVREISPTLTGPYTDASLANKLEDSILDVKLSMGGV